MSWVEELGKVYELCTTTPVDGDPLLPVAHSTANAQIEVNINSDGTIPPTGFAERVDKKDQVTLIPVTEASASRTSKPVPHPFADKLMYIAGDYSKYAPCVALEKNKKKNYPKYHEEYLEQLKGWCDSPYSNKAVRAVYEYLSKGTLIEDLVAAKVLETDPDTGKLTESNINNIAQEDCFVRFRVDGEPAWKDKAMHDGFIRFNSMNSGEPQLCYATGHHEVPTYSHPKKIRNAGDGAKLFSTNDESGFSYRGRFSDKEEAVSIGYNFSQEMHNALKWLIEHHGKSYGDLCLITWESALKFVPQPDVDSESLFGDEEPESYEPGAGSKNQTVFSLTGRENIYDTGSKTMLMMLDSAGPGRISMSMYTELATSEYLKNLEKWHDSTAWIRKGKFCSFSMKEIADFAFGTEKKFVDCTPEVLKETVQRLVPCAAEGRHIPADIVNSLFHKACRPSSYENESNWKNVLNCACGMLRRQIIEHKGECTMALDTECRSRSYLYGRLLAVADRAEGSTYDNDSKRTTNARRFFEAFSNHPYTTWAVIVKNLRPYLDRMNEGSRVYYERLINGITDMFDRESFADNSPLAPEFLHAYSSQMNALYNGNQNTDSNKEEN